MKLPSASAAIVDERKISLYLLNPAHPDNGGKAAYFEALGFARSQPSVLAEAIRQAATGDILKSVPSPHGEKYLIDAFVTSPEGRVGPIRTIWIVDKGTTTPRFVTAYPRE